MLSLFNKSPTVNSFTLKQKQVILVLIMMICSVDTDESAYYLFSQEEASYIDKVKTVLNIETTELDSIAHNKMEEHFSIIKTFNTKQREWFSLTVYEAMIIDGRPSRREIFMGTSILNAMEINLDKHKEIISRLWSIDNIGGHLTK